MDGALPCPCGSGSLYGACCAPMHAGTSVAATPLELLRSRYCAYVLRLPDYVVDTTSPECEEWPGVRSTYLSTVRAAQKQMLCEGMTLIDDPPGAPAATSIDEAYISFKVIFGNLQRQKATGAPVAPRVERMERSLFKRTKGRWAYVSSEVGSNMLPPI